MDIKTVEAKKLLQNAKNIIILAGAGMSVELGSRTYWSGHNSVYGDTKSKYGFSDLEHSQEFLWQTHLDSQLAFYQDSWEQMLERQVDVPGSPYMLLIDYINKRELNYFVATTNVDSAFIRAGFNENNIYEIHGSYRNSQCLNEPGEHGVFLTKNPYEGVSVCPVCDSYARPNVLFFSDSKINYAYIDKQMDRFEDFKENIVPSETVAVEVGAGNTIPTIRNTSVILNGRLNIPVIRINPNDVEGVDGIARIIPRSKVAPFIDIRKTATSTLEEILP